jgi:DNA invertase Pin-like site-specific DNA recombinase
MRSRCFDILIVWKFDRLGRSTSHLLQVLEELKNKRVRLIATSQSLDTNTPIGKFFFTILSGFAEMEREIIRDRINLGIKKIDKSISKDGFYKTKKGTILKKKGRPFGSKDKRKRRKSGYFNRWK